MKMIQVSSRYKEAFEEAKKSPTFWTEKALLDIARRLVARMSDLGLNQKALAEKAGKKPAYVSRVLKGQQNLTVETVATVAHAMGLELDVQFREIEAAQPSATAPAKKVILTDAYSVHGIDQAQYSQVTVRHLRLAANNGSLNISGPILQKAA
jgi:transcriptional regulator with XRE-family HTH domain